MKWNKRKYNISKTLVKLGKKWLRQVYVLHNTYLLSVILLFHGEKRKKKVELPVALAEDDSSGVALKSPRPLKTLVGAGADSMRI